MNNFNRTLPRRTFLRGLGATMALPLLDSMTPRAVGHGRRRNRRCGLGYVYTPNGIIGASDKSPRPFMWTPKTAGANFEFSPTMKALEPFREHINVFSGLAQVNGRALGDGPGDHARATATFLTGVHPYKTGGADFKLGISADQIAAKEFGKYTQLSSLELGARAAAARRQLRLRLHLRVHVDVVARTPPARCRPKSIRGRCSSGCSATATAPMPAARMARLEHQKSVLDYVTGSLSRLQRDAGRRRQAQARGISRGGPRHRAADSARRRAERHDGAAAHRAAERDSGRLRAVHAS